MEEVPGLVVLAAVVIALGIWLAAHLGLLLVVVLGIVAFCGIGLAIISLMERFNRIVRPNPLALLLARFKRPSLTSMPEDVSSQTLGQSESLRGEIRSVLKSAMAFPLPATTTSDAAAHGITDAFFLVLEELVAQTERYDHVMLARGPRGEFAHLQMKAVSDRSVEITQASPSTGFLAMPLLRSSAPAFQSDDMREFVLWLAKLVSAHMQERRNLNNVGRMLK